ncbi:MAG: SRPBCC family protein [Solirubrobacterales bacterium]
MARYCEEIRVFKTREQAFDYLADFATVAEWDPGIERATRLTSQPIGVGSRFLVVASVLGRELELTYTITEYERPIRVVLEADERLVSSVDEITFRADGEQTVVTYDANLRLWGPLKLYDPGLRLAFSRVGSQAADGMRETLGSPE